MKTRFFLYFFLYLLFWSCLVAILAVVNYHEAYNNSLEIVKSSAINSYNKDLIYRLWATMHGGVYVPVTDKTPPNPLLSNLPERDISTPSGKKLTLVNPAYMTRQVNELGNQQFGLEGHITSLKPLRPANAPDGWERKVLLAFEQGLSQSASLEMIRGKEYFRFMKPFIVEQGCLKCHSKQGYKLGDIRGGISVSVPWEPVKKQLFFHLLLIFFTYGGIWIIGIAGAWFIMKRIHDHQKKQAKMEDSIGKSELLYRNLFDKANEGLILLSMEGNLVEVNNSFAEMHGYTVDEMKKIDIKELDVLNEKAFKGRAEVVQRINAGETVRFEVEHYHKVGHIVTLSATVSLIDIGGRPFYLAFHQDISEHRVAQEMLQSSEKRYRTTLESISDAFFSLDNELRFTYFNKQAEELLLKKTSEVLGKQIFSEVFEEAKGSLFEEKYAHALAGKEISTFETFFGIEPYINWYDVRVYPGAEGISVFFTVITEKKKSDLALRLILSKYQTLFDLFPAGIMISDSQGQIIETNSVAKSMLGLAPEQQKQRKIDGVEWQIVRPDGSPMPASEYASVRALNEKCQVENVEMGILKGEDQVTWINVSATPIPIEGYGVAIVYNDITARKEADKEIRLLNETLEQRVAERTNQLVVMNKELTFHLSELEQFSYVSNHDLQEPLRTINQFILLFNEKYAGTLDEEGEKYIEFISKSAARMSSLVKDLLDYSLLGKEGAKTLVDCNKIVEAVLNDLDDTIKGSSAKLIVQDLPTINGYETELRLLFQNLIENAIKYQKPDMVPEINISAESHGGEWLFSIKDNGIGFDKKHYEKIFIIFKRLHKRSEYHGTGIGLAHCKKIVEMHGGRIWVESTSGAGSTFMFTIPKV
ncbi:MAG: PAS domain S-box protein [bacterium]